MDNYTVGCIADLISHNKLPKVKPKKKKSISTNETTEIEDTKENSTTKFELERKKNIKKIKNKTVENPVNNVVSSKSPIDNDSEALENKTEKKAKKRKKDEKKNKLDSSETPDLTPQPQKKKKNKRVELPDFDHVPTDSEEDESGDLEADTKKPNKKQKNKVPIKKLEYKDFVDHTVFVGNIPINYDKQKILKVFSKFGKIISARIRCVPIAEINMSKKVAAVKKQFNPKRNSLVAYVKYEAQESANAALKANGMVIDGHHLRVDLAEQNKERDNNKAVFVGGLPFDIEDDELWEFFETCGKINSVRVIRDSHTSMGKGFGYVNFDSTASVELALQLDGQQLKKRNINVKRCTNARNKNKLNAFGRKKSRELTNELLCKKGKKFKTEKKRARMENSKSMPSTFQGNKANVKTKKKKKLSKAALHKKKIVKILGSGIQQPKKV